MQSMSEPSAITGLPDPQLAMNAVGMPAMPSCTVKPFFFKMSVRYFDVSNSWNPSSAKLNTWSFMRARSSRMLSTSRPTSRLYCPSFGFAGGAAGFAADCGGDAGVCGAGEALRETVTTTANTIVNGRNVRINTSPGPRLQPNPQANPESRLPAQILVARVSSAEPCFWCALNCANGSIAPPRRVKRDIVLRRPSTARLGMINRMDRFEPRASLRNGHWMTLYSWGNPRYFPSLPPPTRRYFDVALDARVVADCHWQARPWEHPTLLALHGLNGSSDAHYMKGLAAKAFAHGMNVLRLNQRNCGDTEHLSAGLFHSGLTADAAHVVHELTAVDGLPAIAVAGYSLGGNLALKLAGEYGAFAPASLVAVAAVSPIIEIEECTRALERPDNAIYNWNFVKDLKRRMRRKERLHPGRFDLTRLNAIKTVREFDPAITSNPHIELHLCAHGGHCGFVGPRAGEDDGYWAEQAIVDFVARHADAEDLTSRKRLSSG